MATTINHLSSKADMLAYAADELGIKLDESKSRNDIWNEIKDLDSSLPDTSESAPTGEAHVEPTISADQKQPERVLIALHQPPGSDDPEFEPDTHVVVGVNGVNYQLEIGPEIPVKFEVYDVLRNAKQKKYYRVKNAHTQEVELKCKEVLRHPFTLIKYL